MNKFIKYIDTINDKVGSWISWLTLVLVLVVCYDVLVRYFFRTSSVALQEIEWHLFSIIFLMAAAFTYKADEHVRVDIIYTKLSERGRGIINLLGNIFLLIPFCVVIIIVSEDFVLRSFQNSEISPDAGGLPARFIIKSLIPISFFLLLLQSVSSTIKSFIIIKNSNREKRVNVS
jgi:TRAP-type mannitol/chloroaromatic compound transport system permease small subunit